MIIKELIAENICFAVIVYHSYLTKAKIVVNQEWEIIAGAKDYRKLSKKGFQRNNSPAVPAQHRNPDNIISRELDLPEISEFLQMKDDAFVKVLEDETGMIWELKDQSLIQFLK